MPTKDDILRELVLSNIDLLRKVADLNAFLHSLTKEQISAEKAHVERAATGLASLAVLLATYSKEKS